ncbi:MAG: tetraacyldisaccharide 4'-kinase [Rhodanobacteraceae bacterium]
MPLADSLQRRWYENRSPPWWTVPVSLLYGAIVRARRALHRRGWMRGDRLPLPVIVVGNLTMGGAGKTPLVIALIEALRERGFKPSVVSRGYGGSARALRLLDAQPDPNEVGDEPALIRIRTGAPVAVGSDRPAAARLLLGQDIDVILADDGLQHYALARDVEICVIDGARRFGNGRLLPAGPLREPMQRLREVDFNVCNGGTPASNEIPMRLAMDDARNLLDPSRRRVLPRFAGQCVHAIAGIGNPDRFFDALRVLGIDPIAHPFADHRHFVPGDLDFGDGLPVLMTEKDAVKCRAFAKDNWWSVPVTAQLPRAFLDELADRLAPLAKH